jgi:hypothetical protein
MGEPPVTDPPSPGQTPPVRDPPKIQHRSVPSISPTGTLLLEEGREVSSPMLEPPLGGGSGEPNVPPPAAGK